MVDWTMHPPLPKQVSGTAIMECFIRVRFWLRMWMADLARCLPDTGDPISFVTHHNHIMPVSFIPATAILAALSSLVAFAGDAARVVLGGEVGNAASACAARLRFAPFDSLPWLRADLSGEKATEFDEAGWGHVLFRPFKNYSGDISGRFIESMAMDSGGDLAVHPAFKGLLEAVAQQQRPGGYFCASGVIDWQQPIDHPNLQTDDAWCATAKPVNEVEFIFAGGVYAENRRCTRLPNGPKPGEPFVIGYGPKLLAAEGRAASNIPAWPATLEALEKHGLKPMNPELRRKDGCFVIGCGE